MLITTETLLAMRCPECGKLEFHQLSRFAFSGRKAIQITCSCGAVKLTMTTKKGSGYFLHIPCLVCEGKHLRSLSVKRMWSGEVTELFCPDTGMELGYLGPSEEVRSLMSDYEDELEALVNEFDSDDYFHNSEIMYEVLNCLHDIAEQGLLYCQCGNTQIEVDIFPDRLELHCKRCNSINIIYAETEEDLNVIQQVEEIELAQNGFECLDSLASTSKPKKQRRKRKNKT